jgi:hypothetical protein
MTIHPHKPVPITQGRPRRSRASALLTLLAIAAMLGIGIIAFSTSIPHPAGVEVMTVGRKP